MNDVSVSVNNSTLDLSVGDKFTIVADTVHNGLNVTFIPDDSGVVSVDENGVVTALKGGTASIIVKVGGDGVYAEDSTVVNITVNKLVAEIVIVNDTLNVKVLNFTSVGASLDPADAGVLTYTSSNSSVVTVMSGIIVPVGVGQAIITVSFAGNDKYLAAENRTITVNVSLNDTSVSVDKATLDLKVGDNYAINATTVPAVAQLLNITYASSDVSVVVVDEKGIVTAVGEGNAIITISVGDDKVFAKNSTQISVAVTSPIFKLSKNKNVAAVYSAKATYKVLVTRDGKAVGASEKVIFNYNGKTYPVKTDKNGYATLNINTKVKVKKYDITATYKGVKVTNKVTIKHVIKAGNKKVKKSKKVTKVKVSLIKVNGKYLKAKKLKIKFNKKTYKVKTNKKGVATWKVKKSMLKKLKVGKKYKYTVTYGKDVVTKKLTIIK